MTTGLQDMVVLQNGVEMPKFGLGVWQVEDGAPVIHSVKSAIKAGYKAIDTAKIYNNAFSKDPEFYSLYRTLESYKKTIGEDTMIILPSDSPYAKLLQGYVQ